MKRLSEESLKERLKNLAKEKSISVNELLKKLYLERFLARLAKSPYSHKMIFKGGNLLNYYLSIGRQTSDLDFLVTQVQAEENTIKVAFEAIAQLPNDDGFELSFVRIESLVQPHMSYPGFRTILKIKFIEGSLRDNLQIDIGVGDLVEPKEKRIELLTYKKAPFFEESVSLLVYTPEAIFAEKLQTVVSKGSTNSRMKDFHDLILLARDPDMLSKDLLAEVIVKTFDHRKTQLDFPIEFPEADYPGLNRFWESHSKTVGKWWTQNQMPLTFEDAVSEVNQFLELIPFE